MVTPAINIPSRNDNLPQYVVETENPYQSMSQGHIAHRLADEYLAMVRKDPALGGPYIADKVARITALLWPELPPNNGAHQAKVKENHAAIRAATAAVLEALETLPAETEVALAARSADDDAYRTARAEALDAQRVLYAAAYAKIGHLYDFAGQVARDNFFQAERKKERGYALGSSTHFIKEACAHTGDVGKVVEVLNIPEIEHTITAHPTEVSSGELTESLYGLGLAVDRRREFLRDDDELVRAGRVPTLAEAMRKFAYSSLVTEKNGQAANLTVRDEMKKKIYFMKNVYEAMPRIYRKFDAPLQNEARKRGQEYDPADLNLKIRFSDWTVGDNDGNARVNAQTTLEGFVLNKLAIARLYLADLEKSDLLPQWRHVLGKAVDRLTELDSLLENTSELGLSEGDLDRLSERLAEISRPLDTASFERDLLGEYRVRREKAPKAHDTQAALHLLRRARRFEFHNGRPEYRQTAEEYTRVTGAILDHAGFAYSEMNESERREALTEILQAPGKARELWQAFRKEWPDKIKDAARLPYSGRDVFPILYHTMKRMELARNHPEMVTDNVLAECDDASKALEMVFLQQAAADERGRRPLLGVIPLFEKPEVMARAGGIAEAMYENPAYREHLGLLQKDRGSDAPVQQFQIAHSDNMRRASLTGARPDIYTVNQLLPKIGKRFGIVTQLNQGGSRLDPNRNGVRSPTAMVMQYGMQRFAKFTLQGVDCQYLNYFPSMTRLYANNFSYMARLLMPEVFLDLAEKAQKKSKVPPFMPELIPADRETLLCAEAFNLALAQALREAAISYYQDRFFHKGSIGILLAQLGRGFNEEKQFTTAGSRAPSRAEGQGPAARTETPETIDPDGGIRTITFSLLPAKEGLRVAWLGHSTVPDAIAGLIERAYDSEDGLDPKVREFLQRNLILRPLGKFERNGTGLPFHPLTLYNIYEGSAIGREAIDFTSYAIALTDLEAMEKCNPQLAKYPELLEEYREEYRKSARIVYAAMTGRTLKEPEDKNDISAYRDAVTAAMPHAARYIEEARIYTETWMMMNDKWRNDPVSAKLGRHMFNGNNTALQGRPPISDPTYCMQLAEAQGINLNIRGNRAGRG